MGESLTEPVRALEARYYTDPALYRRELEGLLARTWQFAGHIAQLPGNGSYFTAEIADQSLVVVRDAEGEVRCFYNVCQHRAHPLVQGSGKAKLLLCPYHAWSYALDGSLRGAPNAQSTPGFDKASICLTGVRAEVFHGFIFVNLDPQAAPMDEWFPGVSELLGEYVPNIAELAPIEWVEIPENCNWKVSVENYSECYHCKLNHPTFATGVVKPETYDIQPAGGYSLRHTTECQHLDKMSYPIDPDANPRAGEYSSWFLWPLFSFQVYPGNVLNTYHWRPTGTETVTVYRGWYTPGGDDSAVIRQLAVQDRQTTVEEDIGLVESVQRGLRSRGYKPGPLVLDPSGGVSSEHSIRVQHQWMRDALND